MKEALYYEKLDKKNVKCELCPKNCIIQKNKIGLCKARKNLDGKLYSLVYGNPCAMHIDPLSKKPIYHMLPNSYTFSIGTVGCNLKCSYCQNWEISYGDIEKFTKLNISAKEIVNKAIKNQCKSISYTYNEPTVFYEYVLDICKIAKKNKIKNVIVSNGFINTKPLKRLCKYLDAANIDIKFFSNELYEKICLAKLDPILNSLKILKNNKILIEITNLLIPKMNDDSKTIKNMCSWILNELGPDTPLHFSRFYPMYKLRNLNTTPTKTLEKAREIAINTGLKYVYIGNVSGIYENTYCPKCKKLLIDRSKKTKINIIKNKCTCGEEIQGIW